MYLCRQMTESLAALRSEGDAAAGRAEAGQQQLAESSGQADTELQRATAALEQRLGERLAGSRAELARSGAELESLIRAASNSSSGTEDKIQLLGERMENIQAAHRNLTTAHAQLLICSCSVTKLSMHFICLNVRPKEKLHGFEVNKRFYVAVLWSGGAGGGRGAAEQDTRDYLKEEFFFCLFIPGLLC